MVPVHALTVDVESWLDTEAARRRSALLGEARRIEEGTARLLDFFSAHGVRATFFVLGRVAEEAPRMVRRIAEAGHELASHGWSHRPLQELTPQAFREEIRATKAILEDIGGREVTGHRSPSWSMGPRTLWALEELVAAGYRYDASLTPGYAWLWGTPGIPGGPHRLELGGATLLEFPNSVPRAGLRLPFAGGFFLRAWPAGWIRRALRWYEEQGDPAVVYVHPWEVDPDMPRVRLGPFWSFVHYAGLARMEARLRELLQTCRFLPLAELAKLLPADRLPVVRLAPPVQAPAGGRDARSRSRHTARPATRR